MLNVDLSKIAFEFESKPLLIGGMAMEYYGIRKAGADIDLVVSADDHVRLVRTYPDSVKDLAGDLGVCEFEFEIWNTICRLDYTYLRVEAIEESEYLVVSIERLLLLKAIAMRGGEKYVRDVDLIASFVLSKAYRA